MHMLKQLDSSVTQDENGELGGAKKKRRKRKLRSFSLSNLVSVPRKSCIEYMTICEEIAAKLKFINL